MQLTDKDISEFVEICRQAFGVKLTAEEAREIATRYLHLLDMLARPLPKEARRDDLA